MLISIGEREFDTGRMKAKTLREILAICDEAEKSENAVKAFEKTIGFYMIVLSAAGYDDVTPEWLEESLDAYQCVLPYMIKELLPQLMERPKNGQEREATEKESALENSSTSSQ